MRITWIQPEDVLRHELVQSAAEGRDVAGIGARWMAAGGASGFPMGGAGADAAPPRLVTLARELLLELATLPTPSADAEPDDLAAIEQASGEPVDLPGPPTDAVLTDRIRGAWLGRAAGCLLGKPVEKVPRRGIREILQSTGRWPVSAYFTAVGLPPDVAACWPWYKASKPTSLAEVIDGMPEDDDLNYALLALSVLEQHGDDFTTDDVAKAWLDLLPGLRVFTAERVAYRSLLDGLEPPATATVGNPYREWIGAQIRTDVYGWTHPGKPGVAAELAWRDARLSHTRNGIYGARYVAAMSAAAMVTSDLDAVLDSGESVVPRDSRLRDAIRWARGQGRTAGSFEDAVDGLEERYADLHWVHVLNNAALTTLALVFGQGDFSRSICYVVQGGLDTDSNGATVGSIAGAITGADALPDRWTAPLRDRLASSMPGFDGISFGRLAARTMALLPERR